MTTLILPGWQGSGPDHWQAHWLELLDETVLVQQRDWEHPELADWLDVARSAILSHPNSILVGHSLGAILIAHLAARYPDLPIAGALLVAPADVDNRAADTPAVASFAPIPTAPLGFPAIVVGSRDDPWMQLARTRVLSRMWEADFVDAGRVGHINAATDLGTWPQGQRLLARLTGDVKQRSLASDGSRGRAGRNPVFQAATAAN